MRRSEQLLEVIDKSYNGPIVDEREFELEHVAAGVTRVLEEYEIAFDVDRIVQRDDSLADRLWSASKDFLSACGIYNTSTHRLIQFSGDEIERAIADAPAAVEIGSGSEARRLVPREVEDTRPPQVSGGPIGTPLSEDQWVPIMQSYWQEPILDVVVPGTLATTHGRQVRSKSPLEVLAAWQEYELGTMAAERSGRPGLSRMCVEMSISDVGHLSAISRGGFSPTDTHLVPLVGEMKTNNELLNKAAHSHQQGGVLLGFYNPILGGLAGGAEGVALLILAGFLGMHLIYIPDSVESCPTHPFHFNSTGPQILRAVSAACTAASRNSGLLTEFMTSPVSGPGMESLFYECAAMATLASVCGASRVLGVRSAVGVAQDHCTGLEARFNGEVAHAATGLTREAAEELIQRALDEYEAILGTKPTGRPFGELYDLETIQPRADWERQYEIAKERVSRWGLPL